MRPGIGLDNNAAEPSRPRKSSNAEGSSVLTAGNTSATTFFLCRDPDGANRQQPSDRNTTTSFSESPLSSLQDTISEADRLVKQSTRQSAEVVARSGSRRRSTIKVPLGTAERLLRRGSSNASAGVETAYPAQPTTPEKESTRAVTPSPLPSRNVSLPSSPKSLASRQSHSKFSSTSDDELLTNADETGSQAILSSEEEDEHDTGRERNAIAEIPHSVAEGVQDSQPELIMPSIKMPSRRPFTQRGSRLGRFKIMVAGRKGPFPLKLSSISRC